MNGRTYCATLGDTRVLVMVGGDASAGMDTGRGQDGGTSGKFCGGDEAVMGDEDFCYSTKVSGPLVACSAAASVAALALRGFDVVGVSYSDDECAAEKLLRVEALADMRASKPSLSNLYDTSRPSSPSPGMVVAGDGGIGEGLGSVGCRLSRDLQEFCILPHQEAPGASSAPELRLWRITGTSGDCQFGTMAALRDFNWLEPR
jgi:hypothetical protein